MRAALVAVLILPLSSPAHTQSRCQLEGVWELISGKADGTPYPAGIHEQKFITKTRWAWVTKEDAEVKELKSAADSLKAFRATTGGSGTYTVQGTTYTEKIEFFPEIAFIGTSIPFSCRVEGDRFYQSGKVPILRDGKKVRDVMIEEVYRRIE